MYSSIVVGTDGTPTSARAVEAATNLALANDAVLHLVSAYRPAPMLVAGTGPGMMESAVVEAGEDLVRHTVGLLEQQRNQLTTQGVKVETHTGAGEASDVILDVAERCAADLVVVGSKGMTGARQILGSVPNRVSHRAKTSVLIVKTT